MSTRFTDSLNLLLLSLGKARNAYLTVLMAPVFLQNFLSNPSSQIFSQRVKLGQFFLTYIHILFTNTELHLMFYLCSVVDYIKWHTSQYLHPGDKGLIKKSKKTKMNLVHYLDPIHSSVRDRSPKGTRKMSLKNPIQF